MSFASKQIDIPDDFMHIKYKSNRIPGVKNQYDLTLGANCQVFVYALLKNFNKSIPNFRSSELWEDTTYTTFSKQAFLPLDIMLYNKTANPFGAHIGLYLGNNRVLHLAKSNQVPKIETHDELLKQEKYSCFIGAKRVL